MRQIAALLLWQQWTHDHLRNHQRLMSGIEEELSTYSNAGQLRHFVHRPRPFQQINDTWGHHAGDMVLHEAAAQRLRTTLRLEDFVGRYGGENLPLYLRLPNWRRLNRLRSAYAVFWQIAPS